MGIGDTLKSTVVSVYKADTKQHRAEVKRLRGDQKKQAKELLDSLEKQNAQIDSQIARWAKVGIAVGAAAAAVATLKVGFEAFEKDAQLRLAATGANIEALQEATRGLVSEQRLLEFAAANNNTQFRISAEELQVAAKAAITLRNQNNDLGDTFDRLQKAIVEGSTEPLKELGITIEASSGTMEASRKIVERLREENRSLGADTELATDNMRAASVRLEDAYQNLKVAVGELAVKLTPLVEGLADFVDVMLQADAAADGFFLTLSDGAPAFLKASKDFNVQGASPELLELLKRLKSEREFAEQAADFFNTPFESSFSQPAEEVKTKRARRGGRTKKEAPPLDPFDALTDADIEPQQDLREFLLELGEQFEEPALGAFDSLRLTSEEVANLSGNIKELTDNHKSLAESQLAGTIATESVTAAFQVATGAAESSFQAWASGSKTVSEAIDQLIGNVLTGLATEMFARALFHGAQAIGSLATPGGQAAGVVHLKAAGLFAAGAATVGGLSRAFGGNAPGSAAGAPAPSVAGLGGSGGGANGGQLQQIIVLGNAFGADDERRNAERTADFLRRAEQWNGSRGHIVEYA